MNAQRVDLEYFELVKAFPLVPIRDDKHLSQAVKVMKKLAFKREELSRGAADYLTVLGDLMAVYERRIPHLGTELTPAEAVQYLLDVNGLSQKDIVSFVGHKSNLSAFLAGQRGLSKVAAARLAAYFSVSPALFLPK